MGEWVPFLVRREDLVAHAELAARLEAGRPDVGPVALIETPDAGSTAGVPSHPQLRALELLAPWDEASLRQLAASKAVTMQRWALALDFLCVRANQFFSTEEVAAGTGLSVEQWRDAPRKVTRHLERHFNVPGWPAASVDGREMGAGDEQVYWALNAEQAARWRKVRGISRTPAVASPITPPETA